MIFFRPIGLFGAGLVGANLAGLAFAIGFSEARAFAIHSVCLAGGCALMRYGMIRRAG